MELIGRDRLYIIIIIIEYTKSKLMYNEVIKALPIMIIIL
jgi:hypothetical protein